MEWETRMLAWRLSVGSGAMRRGVLVCLSCRLAVGARLAKIRAKDGGRHGNGLQAP